jgi:hypothetical protein
VVAVDPFTTRIDQAPVQPRRVQQPDLPQNELVLTLSLPPGIPIIPYDWPIPVRAPRTYEQWQILYPHTLQPETVEPPPTEAPEIGGGGGWWPWWRIEEDRRQRERERLKQLRADTDLIDEPIAREIAKIERDIESVVQRNEELSRLRQAAEKYGKESATNEYNERVAAALDRAIRQGNYSALEALEREMLRAEDEQAFLLMALTLILSDN